MTDREKLIEWQLWVDRNIDRLRQEYGGEWIAVIDYAVVQHHTDPTYLSNLCAEFDQDFHYTEYIHTQESAELWRGLFNI